MKLIEILSWERKKKRVENKYTTVSFDPVSGKGNRPVTERKRTKSLPSKLKINFLLPQQHQALWRFYRCFRHTNEQKLMIRWSSLKFKKIYW